MFDMFKFKFNLLLSRKFLFSCFICGLSCCISVFIRNGLFGGFSGAGATFACAGEGPINQQFNKIIVFYIIKLV